MARFSSSSSSSSSSSRSHGAGATYNASSGKGARATYNASSGKRSPSAYDEVVVKYPNGVSTVIHHSNFRASSIGRIISNDSCKDALRAAVELSLFCGPDWEFTAYKRFLSEDCGIELDVGSSKNGSSKKD